MKHCITNYAVANGYQLRFEKCDRLRLIVRCGKIDDVENMCPYRLYGAWMGNERTFQVKKLRDEHICSRDYSHNHLTKPTWIAKSLLWYLIANQELTLKEMRKLVLQKCLCYVSQGQCQRARERALYQIEGSLTEHYAKI